QTRSHRLDEDHTERFAADRRTQVEVARGGHRRQLGMRDRAEHPYALAMTDGQPIDDVALRPVAGDDQEEVLPRRDQTPEGLDRHWEPLALVEAAHEQDLGP